MKKSMLEQIQNRRSCRKFTSQPIGMDFKEQLIKAVLWSPTSKNNRPWEFVFIENKESIEQLSKCKPHGAAFLAGAPLAVVILADPAKSDVWVEDCSIAAILLQMVAEDLGLGSTWIQVRLREHDEKLSASDYVKGIIKASGNLEVASIIAIGYKEREREPYTDDVLLKERVHLEAFQE
ncbi:nitroreductase family protein [Natronoflexus pectinivorans]|uniref:Nitroreductase n=1 Tax=Natronoflexus pectinivorans TaxID=682526 RepID=A0A4R2GI45_9BACT|nr:nitroreductase family protein [Natronoflexus pectinivorans]TCO06959.1 nitroreductase [Natronoflexus pectinivorans]